MNTKEHFEKYTKKLATMVHGPYGTTPISYVEKSIDSLPVDWSNPNLRILDPCFGFGTYLFFAYLKLLNYHDSSYILDNMLYGYEISEFRFRLTKHKLNIKNLHHRDFLEEKINMKFDIILANYPFQKPVGPNKTESIWHLFPEKVLSLLNEGGILSVIHPSDWRNAKSKFDKIKELYLSQKILSLDLNDFKKGKEVFNTATSFDIITLVKTPAEERHKTEIIDNKDIQQYMDLNNIQFIPNSNFEKIFSLVATAEDERINVLFDRTSYGNDKLNMSLEKNKDFQYPCVYTITRRGGINIRYSSEKKGHFGVPKVIWSKGLGTYPIVDEEGKYGVMNFAAAIIDDVENLDNIKSALESKSFLELMKSIKFSNDIYDYRIISTFRKDFWKDFV
tara:strand:+ start:485 stop:1660 length:1176 start_codon:yes stop_codon:yes gene_type:complete